MKYINVKLFFLTIISLVIISCSLVTSGNSTKITKREETTISKPLSTPTDDIGPSSSDESFSPTNEELKKGESPLSPEKKIVLSVVSLSSGNSQNGWKPYQSYLAIKNTGSNLVLIGDSNEFGIPVVNINTDESFIETVEGKTYPAAIILYGNIPLSPNIALTGTIEKPFTASFKVPELLHPTRLVIRPGIFVNKDQPKELSVNLNDPPENFPKSFLLSDLPDNIQLSNELQATIFPPTGELIDAYGYRDASYTVYVGFVIKNSDISNNQSAPVSAIAIDSSGRMYFNIGSSDDKCNFMGMNTGPGQEVRGNLCFVFPTDYSKGDRPFHLIIIGDNINKIYGIQIPSLPK